MREINLVIFMPSYQWGEYRPVASVSQPQPERGHFKRPQLDIRSVLPVHLHFVAIVLQQIRLGDLLHLEPLLVPLDPPPSLSAQAVVDAQNDAAAVGSGGKFAARDVSVILATLDGVED